MPIAWRQGFTSVVGDIACDFCDRDITKRGHGFHSHMRMHVRMGDCVQTPQGYYAKEYALAKGLHIIEQQPIKRKPMTEYHKAQLARGRQLARERKQNVTKG
jgi:hypothetical protein